MEEAQMTQLRWDTALGDARDTQRREFREWVMCVHEELKTNGNGEKGGVMGAGVPRSESAFSIECSMTSSAPVLQESFTITLGAQMKQMHNLRSASLPLHQETTLFRGSLNFLLVSFHSTREDKFLPDKYVE